jgi:hypothetical protein
MSFTISTYLAAAGCTQRDLQSFGRYSHSFYNETTSCISERFANGKFCNNAVSSNDLPDKSYDQKTDSRESRSVTQLPVDIFSNSKTRRNVSPDLQLEKAERICTYPGFSSVQPFSSTLISSTQRLDGKARFTPSLFSPTHNSAAPQVSQGELQRQTLPDDMPTLRAVRSSGYICIGHQLDRGTPQKPQDSLCGVSGRFSSGKSVLRAVAPTGQNYCCFTTTPRMDYQHREICSGSDTTPRVSRRYLGHTTQLQVPVGTEVPNAPQRTSRTERQLVPQTGPVPNGETQLCLVCHSEGKAPLSNAAVLQQTVAKIPTPQTIHNSGTSFSRNELVGENGFQFDTYTYEVHHSSSNHRRFRCGLGSTTRTDIFIRSMDNRATELARKLQRTVCSLPSSSTGAAASEKCPRTPSNRQLHSRSLYKQRGWHEVQEAVDTHQRTVSSAGLSKRKFDGAVLPRAIQYRSRCTVTQEDESRVAFAARSHETSFPALGKTGGGSICLENSSCGAAVCINRSTRRRSTVSQRFSPMLELQSSLDLPPTKPCAPSAQSSQQGAWQVCTDSTEMGKSVLAGGPATESYSKTTSNKEPVSGFGGHKNRSTSAGGSEHVLGGLADTRWASMIKNWTDQEKSLFLASWRPSTIRTYAPAWNRWKRWCLTNSVDFQCPDPSEVARYLAYLHIHEGLAYRTILLQKSVIATLTKMSGQDVTSNFLVKQILRAISVNIIKASKPPIWDPRIVLVYLSNNSIDENNLYQVSQRVAVLLLLASSRRVHDLTLLRIGPDHLIDEGNSIVMWPVFGSKTDNVDRRQSGWKIKEHPDKNLNAVYWIRRLVQVSQQRRDEGKWSELFITTRSQSKPATKTIIGGWIKAALREAGIEASPGSVRSAVSSLNWLENYSIEKILATGNWRQEHTFKNYYCKPLAENTTRSVRNVSLSQYFEATYD